MEILSQLKNTKWDLIVCEQATYDESSCKEYWIKSKIQLINYKDSVEKAHLSLIISGTFLHEISSDFNVPNNLGDSTFLNIDTCYEQNRPIFWNYLDSQFPFQIYLNSFEVKNCRIMYNSADILNREWVQGILLEDNDKQLFLYADNEYGNRSVIKICFDSRRIRYLLTQWNFKEVLI